MIPHSLQEFCSANCKPAERCSNGSSRLPKSSSDSSEVEKHSGELVGEGGAVSLDGKTGLEVTEELFMMAG